MSQEELRFIDKNVPLKYSGAILSIDPGHQKSLGWSVCQNGVLREFGVIDLRKTTYPEVSKFFLEKMKSSNCEEVIVEDFVYFSSGVGPRAGFAAGGSTISKMKELISFLKGYFCHAGYDVLSATSSVWKRSVGKKKVILEEKLKRILEPAIGRSLEVEDGHWRDAVGLYLYANELRFSVAEDCIELEIRPAKIPPKKKAKKKASKQPSTAVKKKTAKSKKEK